MLPYNSWVSRIAFGVFFIILIGYGYFEARGLLYGPQIEVPDTLTTVHNPSVHIQGAATHIAVLSLNGKQIAVTETGLFDEPYLLAPGTNHIVLDAKDKYGNTAQRIMQVVYIPPKTAHTPVGASATSTTSGLASTTPTSSSTDPLAH